MIIGYARLSTEEQDVNPQLDALRRAGADRIFDDRSNSAIIDRPGLAQALSHLGQGDVLMVWKLNQLGHTMRGLVQLAEALAARGVDFRSLTDGIDTTTPAGHLFFFTLAAMARMEVDLIRERTKPRLAASQARGQLGGRPKKLSENEIAHVRALLKDSSNTIRNVAASLGVSRDTIYRAIRRSKPT